MMHGIWTIPIPIPFEPLIILNRRRSLLAIVLSKILLQLGINNLLLTVITEHV